MSNHKKKSQVISFFAIYAHSVTYFHELTPKWNALLALSTAPFSS